MFSVDLENSLRQTESLASAAKALLRFQLLVFLILWVPISTPLICQFHGLMIHFGTASDVMAIEHLHGPFQHSMLSGVDHDTSRPISLPFSKTRVTASHQTTTSTANLMQSFVAALPDVLGGDVLAPRANLHSLTDKLPSQRNIQPPEEPPRPDSLIR